jgi:manganese/zinc/iron transport system permease protein
MTAAFLPAFLSALTFQAGYNPALVAAGATLLGFAAGAAGSFMVLRKRALVADAMAHATLPGIGLAFIVMVSFGGDGRNLAGLLIGSAVTAGIGLWTVDWIVRTTRLAEDAAIGAVLSVFFGLGIVILTIIQTMGTGKQAGLESFLLGSTSGMLFADAVTIAVGGAIALAVLVIMRRPLTLVAFDAGFAQSVGIDVRRADLVMMSVVMGVTVIGLKIVGLIMIVALLIIPAVTARFWTERAGRLVWLSGAFGALAGWVGAALSAAAPDLPTGPIIVLVATGVFAFSLLFAPLRGALSGLIRFRAFRREIHLQQGLVSLSQGAPITDPVTRGFLRRGRLINSDGSLTEAGRNAVARAGDRNSPFEGMTPAKAALPGVRIAGSDRQLSSAAKVPG